MRSPGPDHAAYARVLRRLANEVPRRDLLREMADALLELLDAERLFIFRFRAGGGFRVLVGRNFEGEDVSRPHQRMSHFAVRGMERAGDAWFVADARHDRRYRSEDALAGAKPPRSILLFPLRVEDRVFGGVYADHRFQSFGESLLEADEVRGWLGLTAVAVRLREQHTRARLLEKKLSAGGSVSAAMTAPVAGVHAEPAPSTSDGTSPRFEEFHGFLSANPDIRDAFDDFRRLSDSDIPVLIYGETGVGKSLLARCVHESSRRSGGPFEVFGCGAVPETLIESELLGHVRGAFTGAESDHAGTFARAHRGTLLFDEVGDMPPAMQTKLLRVLEDGRIRPLGSKDVRAVDVRYVATTSRDLERLVREGRFRRDLYFRLKGLVVYLPPLRERREDIWTLTHGFLHRYGADRPPTLNPETLDLLLGYPWPGNVRELENEIRRLAALERGEIGPDDLSPALRQPALRAGAVSTPAGLEERICAVERQAIAEALRRSGGNKSRAAHELGITRKSLYRRLEKYDIGDGGGGGTRRGGGP